MKNIPNQKSFDGSLKNGQKDTATVTCSSCGETFPKSATMSYETRHWCERCFSRESDYMFEELD